MDDAAVQYQDVIRELDAAPPPDPPPPPVTVAPPPPPERMSWFALLCHVGLPLAFTLLALAILGHLLLNYLIGAN